MIFMSVFVRVGLSKRVFFVSMVVMFLLMLVPVLVHNVFMNMIVIMIFINKQKCSRDHQRQRDYKLGIG